MIKEDTLDALEFQRVLYAIAGFTHGEPSDAAARELRPLADIDGIARRSGIIEEIRRLIQSGSPFSFTRFGDISGVLGALRPEGVVLDPLDLVLLKPVMWLAESLAGAVPSDGGCPLLAELASRLGGFPKVLSAIERTVDDEGGILDTASFELGEIRARRRGLDRKIGRRLEEMVRDPARTVFLQDEFITKRSGRWVIPVRMDSKGQVQGVVHDVSRSGETAFMEPLEIIGLSNELENLVADEKAEEIRILRSISRDLRALRDELKDQYEAVVELDLMNSIAVFSERHGLSAPEINTRSEIKLIGARHPLLMLGRPAAVVPLDLQLQGEDFVMLITGPNAGGKTIVIKTVGLLILMALAGIPVPARPSSSLPLLRGLLVDIGDEQSINENLSTFSAHVSNIAAILSEAGPDTVVLLDELGTGTDPSQGGALGCAIIRELMARGSRVLATTHLIDIVGFVHRTEGMVNASMEFDRETHTPLYRLKEGEPGQSHAIEIAGRYGLPESVIGFAREMLGSMQEEFHALLSDLKHKRALHEAALAEAEETALRIKTEGRALEDRLRSIEQEKKEVIKSAYEEAAGIISAVRREAGEALDEVKRQKKRDALKRMEAMGREVKQKLREFQELPLLRAEDVHEGDMVFVPAVGYDAEVAGVDAARGRVRVRAGGKELEVSIEDLAPASGKGPRARVTYEAGLDEPAPTEVNLIGQRVDDALAKLEKFLNRASLAGAREVRVVHGMGTGALRKAVREYLSGHPLCEGHRAGEPHEGGGGATIARLR